MNDTKNTDDTKKTRKRQGGFTLIELISVIIILGILAAVITPKYFDMTQRAQDTALDGATSEAAARLNMAYAAHVLANNAPPATLLAMQGTNATSLAEDVTAVNMGDYSAAYVQSGAVPNSIVTITLSSRSQTGVVTPIVNAGNHHIRIVPWPGN